MHIKVYNKLVRDRISEIIKADGKTCVCEMLFDEDRFEGSKGGMLNGYCESKRAPICFSRWYRSFYR